MPVSPKAILLDALPVARLRELADQLEVNGSRQSKADLVESFTRYRRLSAERICDQLNMDELKACCSHAGLSASARTKQELINALLGGPSRPMRVTPDRAQAADPGEATPRVDDLVHPVPTRNATMTGSQQRAALQRQIWAIANEVRGAVDGWDFKQYVLGALFYRFISENFASYIEADDNSVHYAEMSDKVITPEIKDDAIKTKGYFIYPSQLFVNVVANASDNEHLNADLASIFKAIESSASGYDSEDDIKGLFADFDTTSNRLGNTVADKNTRLTAVLKGVAGLDFGDFHGSQIDLFGDAYEFLISNYAANAGKSGGEFFTPQHVSKLIAKLAMHKQDSVNKIYDPACGSGSLLLQAKKHFDDHIIEEGFFGQEINHTTYNLARMNMFLHNINYDKFHIKLGNTLQDPHFGDEKPFDAIVSNPPYSVKWKGDEDPTLINDERFAPAGVLAPKSKADFAFVLHALHYLSAKGRAAIVCFPGIFYRGGAEQKIRKYLVDNNYVETVIALAPNLFFGTTIAVNILVLSKHKTDTTTQFIDASRLLKKESNNNVLLDEHIDQVIAVFDGKANVEYFAKSVPFELVAAKDYNLSVGTYVEAKDTQDTVDIEQLNTEIDAKVKRIETLRKSVDEIRVKVEKCTKEGGSSFLEKLLDGANMCELILGEVTKYEQPSQYIVASTDYNDDNTIPVLTAGKTFILGYTNETDGIYRASINPVIIFDDFTGAIKWVDFDFKVKSSAMKMITSADNSRFLLKYIYYWLTTLPSELSEGDHKRLWISNYCTKKIPVPSPDEHKQSLIMQQKIVDVLDLFAELSSELSSESKARQRQYEYYCRMLLKFPEAHSDELNEV